MVDNTNFIVVHDRKDKILPGSVWSALSSKDSIAYKWLKGYKGEEGDRRYGKMEKEEGEGGINYRVGGGKDGVEGDPFSAEDAGKAAVLLEKGELPICGRGVKAAYGFSVKSNANPYFFYIEHKDKSFVNKASTDEEKGLLAHIFWVQGCSGYMGDDLVGKHISEKIGQDDVMDGGLSKDYLEKLTEIMHNDNDPKFIAEFKEILEVYKNILEEYKDKDKDKNEDIKNEIERMKEADILAFKVFKDASSSSSGGGIRRTSPRSKTRRNRGSIRRKGTRRKSNKRKDTRRRRR